MNAEVSGTGDRENALGDQAQPNKARAGRPPRSAARDSLRDERESDERGYDEREWSEDLEFSEEDRMEMFKDSLYQSVLPDLPSLPGYHVCWLSTSNQRDSIMWRIRIGYELLKLDDMPGWEGVSLKSGDYAGVIGINEMVAAKIPLTLYNRYMREVHHTRPLAEEEKLRGSIDQMKSQAERVGAALDEGEGNSSLVQKAAPMPEFLA